MARLLYKQDTIAFHKRLARRHIRLCGQIRGGAPYAKAIQPKLDSLIQKENALSVARDASENAYDDMILKDTGLDNAVRTLFERSRQYDRENGGGVSVLLFPDLTFSGIVSMPNSEEPKKVSTLIQKLETLDPSHEIRALADTLQEKLNAVNAALSARQKAADNIRRCQVEEELAKNEVRMQYENNYLDARRTLGKQIAESLFPKIVKRRTKDEEEDVNQEQEE